MNPGTGNGKGTEAICPVCGKKFTAYAGANRKYCSQACYRGGVADEA